MTMNNHAKTKDHRAGFQTEPVCGVCDTPSITPTPEQITGHILQLLVQNTPPKLPSYLATIKSMPEIHSYITTIRSQLQKYINGDFSNQLKMHGVVAGMLKALQANMLHCIWQMEQVKKGDLSQRVDFMGDFSEVFNGMTQQLDHAVTELQEKEAQLASIAHELQQEVEKRDAALSVLEKSAESFKYLAEHDPLTGLLNRRSFLARSEVELARTVIMNHSCVLMVLDVDNFKSVNDTYGHLGGDIALKQIARVCRATLRDADIVGRLGGEEFAVVLAESCLEQGRATAERLRQAIYAAPFKLNKHEVRVTVSLGLTTILPAQAAHEYGDLLCQALSLADQAMYRAKRLGKNRIETAEFVSRDRCLLSHDPASEA